MFASFYSTASLAFESGNVIGLRMMTIVSGGNCSYDEANLMGMETVQAMFETGKSLLRVARRAA